MTIPAALQPHWGAIQTIAAELGVPAPRVGGTVMIESNGDPRAVQENTANGYSYGLMQIVPYGVGWAGWHELIRTTAELPPSTARRDIISALYDPEINLRVGCAILVSLHDTYKTWDRASSEFFLGNPDWRGQDTVNGNTGTWYRDTLNDWIVKIEAGGGAPVSTMVLFEGATIAVPLDVPFRVHLVPLGQTNQRPGIYMVPDRYVQHETDNTNPGANASNQVQYMLNGAEGRQASWHLTVDDTECIQSLPLNEVGWHGGDDGGDCNYHGVACELCVNMKGDPARMAKARSNAEKVAAAVMLAKGLSILEQHAKCCADVGNPAYCHAGCPRYIRAENYWPTFTANVQRILGGSSPVVYASPVLVPGFDGTDKRVGNVLLQAVQRTYTAKRDGVPVLQFADPGAKPTRAPLRKGETFTGWYITKGSDAKSWIVTSSSSRVPMEGVTPQVGVV